MDCMFKNFSFGERVRLGLGYSTCRNCGANVQEVVEGIAWIYRGHSAEFDLFEPEKPICCPVCKHLVAGYMQRCGESGSLEVKAGDVFMPHMETQQ